MSKTTDFIAKITEKLHHDRELRLDISHELQTHLDEAIEEYKASDYNEEDALAAAIKDMGDAEELAEDLWQANRRRMKLRAWCWWIARFSLWPACVVLTLSFIISGMSNYGMLRNAGNGGGIPDDGRFHPSLVASRLIENQMRSQMTTTQKLIAYGDEKAKTSIERWKPLRDAFPNEPLYQLKYISTMINTNNKEKKPENKVIFPELERGRQLDPENGVYDLIEASLLVKDVKFKDDTSQTISMPAYRKEGNEDVHPYGFESPQSIEQMQQIQSLLKHAVSHPYITLHMMDMQRHRMAQLPPAQSMREYFLRVMQIQGGELPVLANNRQLARYIGAAAVQQAQAGQVTEALDWLKLSDQCQSKMAADSDTYIKLMVVCSILNRNLIYKAFVYDAAGDDQAVKRTVEALVASWAEYDQFMHSVSNPDEMEEQSRHSGAMLRTLLRAAPSYKVDATPFRLAEYAMLDRGLLSIMLLGLLAVATLMMGGGVLRVWLAKQSFSRPILLWVGWRRFVKVIGWSVCLPVTVFAVLSQSPLLGRDWGIDQNMASCIWYLPLFVGVWLLLCSKAIDAMRHRASGVGLPVPAKLSRWWLLWMLLAVSVAMLMPFLMLMVSSVYRQRFVNPQNMLIGLWVIEIGLSVVVWLLSAYFTAWLRGIEGWFKKAMHSLGQGMGMMLAFVMVVSLAIGFSAPWRDAYAYISFVVIICVPLGFALSLVRFAGQANHYPQFMVSLTRSMPVFMMASVLLLALVVGQSLRWQERYYANQMQGQSLIFMDLEVQRSDASILRQRWARDEKAPSVMVPMHRVP